MKIASFLFRRRRILLLCAATVALHYLVLNWAGTRIAPAPVPSASAAAPAQITMAAQLRLTLPPAISTAQPRSAFKPKPVVKPAAPAKPVAKLAPTPMLESGFRAAPQQAIPLAEPAPPAGADTVAAALPVVLPAPQPAVNPVAGSGEPVAPLEAAHRYKVDLPPSAEFILDVQRIDADGTVWNGVAAMAWRLDDGHYTMTAEAGLNALITRINLLVLTSEGSIDDSGIAPLNATEKRRGRALTATHFQRSEGRITFSASERSYPLLAGTQDKATLPFQLAGIGRADVNQFSGAIDIFVGEDKEANMFRFILVGEEELDTKMGKLITWRLSRPPKPGTYSSRLDIWLAPSRGWYPVQIRNSEANGALTTQTVSNITLTDSPGN